MSILWKRAVLAAVASSIALANASLVVVFPALADDENGRRQAQLRHELDHLGLHWRAATSQAADDRWQEAACWINGITPALLDQLADRFGQNASLTVAADGLCRLRIHRDDWLPRDLSDDRLQWPN